MKRARSLVIAAAVLAVAACSGSTANVDDTYESSLSYALTSGTSFGMCLGYCTTTLEVAPQSVTLIETSRDPVRQPTRTRSLPLAASDWQRIESLIQASVLASLAGVHGCPDCADGGAEWIELKTASSTVRVTFEFGHPPQAIAQLQAEIRSQRERFPQL